MSVVSTDPPNKDTHPRTLNPALGRGLRVVFLSAVALIIAANILTLPQSYGMMHDLLSGNYFHPLLSFHFISFPSVQINPADYGLSIDFFAALNIAPFLLDGLCSLVAAGYLFYRRPDDRMTIITSVILAILGVFTSPALFSLLRQPIGELLLRGVLTIFNSLFFLYLLVFPDGRFVPRWSRWLLPFTTLLTIAAWWTTSIGLVGPISLILILNLLMGMAQWYRYLRVSTPLQRQQTKWVLYGLGTNLAFNAAILILRPLIVELGGSYFFIYQLLVFPLLWYGCWLVFVAAFSFSILRYNLWNVDFVINRSVVYLALTVLLGALFFGMLLLLQALLERILGSQQTTLATIAATAVVIGTFNPARKGLQRFIDRRIFRLRADLNEIAAAQKKPAIKNPGIYTGRTFGNYEILGVLGKGGMGEVYKAFGNGQIAAIKVLPAELAAKEESRKRFMREAQTLAALEHPNIVKLFGSGVSDDGVHYLAMEYVDGQELGAVIQNGAVTNYADLRDWVNTVASALDYIHGKGLVHRDLKPSNIMLRAAIDKETREAVLMDFGIARVDASGTRLTASGAIGTIDYMAPEQILAAREVDHRSDVYALGIIVYELVTGELPFKGGAGQVLFAHLQKPAPDPRNNRPDVPRSMAKAVLKALEKDPDARYATAGEFAAALITHEALST
ncbi:MAG: serine/threonine-protein kinase [Anaerolineae bacterium]